MSTMNFRQVGSMRGILMAVLGGAVLGIVGCQTIPVQTNKAFVSDPSVATVTLWSAESAFWRVGQDVSVESIDGRIDPNLEGAKEFKFQPGKHTMHIAYYATAGGPVTTFLPGPDLRLTAVTVGSTHYWRNIYDEQDITFEVTAGGAYQLVYDVKQWPTPHNLRLLLIDSATGKTIADSGASKKKGIMPLRTRPR